MGVGVGVGRGNRGADRLSIALEGDVDAAGGVEGVFSFVYR